MAPIEVIKPEVPTDNVESVTVPAPESVPEVMVIAIVPVKAPATANEAEALFKVKLLSSVTVTPTGIIRTSAAVMLKPGAVPPQVVELDQFPVVVAV